MTGVPRGAGGGDAGRHPGRVERLQRRGAEPVGRGSRESRLALAAKALEEVPGLGRGLEVIEEAEEVDVTALETQSDKGPGGAARQRGAGAGDSEGASDVHSSRTRSGTESGSATTAFCTRSWSRAEVLATPSPRASR